MHIMKNRILQSICCLASGIFSLAAPAQEQHPGSHVFDGPYLFFETDGLVARWIEAGELREAPFHSNRLLQLPAGVSASFDATCIDPDVSFELSPVTAFKGVEQIAVLGDPHGQYALVVRLLKAHRIIDEQLNWTFGKGHLVILGDVFDRGDEVTDIFWLILKLEKQALQAGGRVHFILGNHEIMVMENDLRYVHKKYRFTMGKMGKSYNDLFGPDTYIGRWLRSRPVAISINNIAFVHGGFSERILRLRLSFSQINTTFQERIIDRSEAEILADPVAAALYLDEGPVWYRGYFEPEYSKEHTIDMLDRLGARQVVVGHTSFPHITAFHGRRIIAADSSIKTGEGGELLLIHKKKFFRGALDGNLIHLK